MTEPSFQQDYELIVAPNFDPRFTPADIPTAGVFDSPTYMLCINAQWWTHLLGTIDRLAYTDAWRSGDYQQKLDAVDSVLTIMTEIAKSIECGDMTTFELRQNPNNACQLQQSLDGGSTWATAFDYSLCGVGGGTTINITNAQTYIENAKNEWNIDVDLVYKNITINDGDTNASYCHALKVLIIGILQGALERLQNGNNQELVIQAISGGIAIAAAFIFGTPLAGFTTAIGVTLSLATSAIMDQLDENKIARVLGDDNLIDEIRCCVYDNIENTKVSELSFSQMFDNCSSTNADVENAYIILREVVDSFDVFVTFLEAVNVAYDYSVSGALANNCLNCDDWCYSWLGGKGFTPAWTAIQSSGYTNSVYNAVDDRTEGGFKSDALVLNVWAVSFVSTPITSIKVRHEYNITRSTSADGIRIWIDDVLVANVGIGVSGVGVQTYTWTGNITGSKIDVRTASGVGSSQGSAYSRCTSIIVNGTGSNPLGSDNCD